jgi:hypothetical protein
LEKISVPVGFRPSSKELFWEGEAEKSIEEKDVLTSIIDRIVEKTDLKKKKVVEKISQVAQEKNITNEVAALIVGKEYDIQFDGFFADIEKELFEK